MWLGHKATFAAEIGEWVGGLRRVDLWAANRLLTADDNLVFVPQFCASVRATLGLFRSGRSVSPPLPGLSLVDLHRHLAAATYAERDWFRFPVWGPTTDGIEGYHFRIEDRLAITFEFWRDDHPAEERGVVFATEMPEAEFAIVLDEMLRVLEANP